MATAVTIPVEEYLAASYEPDCEYVEGRLVRRNVGEWNHSRLQALIAYFFESHSLRALTEQRCLVAQEPEGPRYRIPDVLVVRPGQGKERVLTQPPFIVVEILSPDDRMSALLEKLEEYRAWGVPHIWAADPEKRKIYEFGAEIWPREVESQILDVPECGLTVNFGEIFGKIESE